MIKPQMPGQGASDFPAQKIAIRTTAVLTTSYVVCKAHEDERLRNGDRAQSVQPVITLAAGKRTRFLGYSLDVDGIGYR